VLDLRNGAAYRLGPELFAIHRVMLYVSKRPEWRNINGEWVPALQNCSKRVPVRKRRLALRLTATRDRALFLFPHQEKSLTATGSCWRSAFSEKRGKLPKNRVVATSMSNLGLGAPVLAGEGIPMADQCR